MFGNFLGWMISACIVVVTGGFLLMISKAGEVSPPTAFSGPKVLAPLPPLNGMNAVLPLTEDADAADAYAKAISSYERNRRAYERFEDGNKSDAATLAPLREGLDALRSATRMQKCTLFTKNPEKLIGYDTTKTDLVALRGVGLAAFRLGFLTRDDDPKEALAWLEAAFGCGVKLFNERVNYDECFVGLELMGNSVAYIAKTCDKLGDKPRADAAREFDQARLVYYTDNLEPNAKVLNVIDPRLLGQYVGDYFVVAEESQERMWRVGAIKTLGIVRVAQMTDKRIGDKLAATRAAQKYAQDPDPVIASAGKKAAELTRETFRVTQ
jgi:hypothetical protein